MNRGDSDKTRPDFDNQPTLGAADSAPLAGADRPSAIEDTLGPEPPERPATPGPDETVLATGTGRAAPQPASSVRNIRVEGYEIREELGRGGMGVVYKALDLSLNRVVALKMILAGVHASEESIARFRVEAEAVAQLQHRGIVQVYDVGQSEGQPYCALEFVEGGALDELLARESMPISESVALVEELAHAMSSAHQAGIVHRDLKPANILLSTRRNSGTSVNAASTGRFQPKITDFGLARKVEQESQQTRTGAIMGTPGYMAPEQARGARRIGPAADIYSLGAILFQLVTGRPPFAGETPIKTIMSVLRDPAVSPRSLNAGIDRDLDTIILKCLEKEPAARYASAEHLAQDLNRYQKGIPIEARPVSSLERVGKWVRRKPWAASLIALSILGLGGLIVGGAIVNRQLAAAYEKADKEHDRAVQALNAESRALAESDRALRRAEASENESRRRLIDNYVNNALQAMNRQDTLQSLPWLAESIALETEPDRQAIHQLRYHLAIQNAPKPAQTWILDSYVDGCHFSADGNQIAGFSGDTTVRIWGIRENRVLQTLQAAGQIYQFAIADDHRQAITVAAHIDPGGRDFETVNFEFQLWDVRSGKLIGKSFEFRSKNRVSLAARLSAAAGTLVRIAESGTGIELVQLGSGEVGELFETDTRPLDCHLDPSGQFAIAQLADQVVVFDTASGAVRSRLEWTPGVEASVSFAGRQRLLVAADRFRVYRLADGELLGEFPRTREESFVVAVGPRRAGLAVAWPDGTLELYDAGGSRIDNRLLDTQVVDLRYSGQGDRLYVATRFQVTTFDAKTGSQQGSSIPVTVKPLRAIALGDDDRRLAIGSGTGLFTGSGCLRVWNTVNEKKLVPLAGPDQPLPVRELFASHGGKYVAVLGQAGRQLKILDVSDRRHPVTRLEIPVAGAAPAAPINFAVWSPDDRLLAIGFDDGPLRVVEVPSGTQRALPAVRNPAGARFNNDGTRLAVRFGEDSRLVTVFDVPQGQAVHSGNPMEHLRSVGAMGFVRGGQALATLSADLNYRLFDVASHELISQTNTGMIPLAGEIDQQHQLLVVGGQRFGSMPGCVMVVDLLRGEPVFEPLGFESPIVRVGLSSDGQFFFAADQNGSVQLFRCQDGAKTGSPMVHPDEVLQAAFRRDGRLLATVGKDRHLRLFDTQGGVPLTASFSHGKGFEDVTFLGSSSDLCCRAENGFIWPVDSVKYQDGHAAALSRFLSGRIISETGAIVPASSRSLKQDFSNVTIRQMMRGDVLRQLIRN